MKHRLKYLIFVLILFFSFNLKVNAFTSYYNFDTTFNVENLFDYSTLLNNSTCGNETYYQFIIDFINQLDLEHSRYHLFITTTHYNNSANPRKGYFHVYAIPKTVLNNQKRLGVSFVRSNSATTGYLFPYNSIDIQQTTQFLDLWLPYFYSTQFDNCSGRYNSLFELNAISTFISYFNDLPWQSSITITEQYVNNVYFYTSQSNFGWINFNQSAQIPGVSNTNNNYLYSNNIDLPIYQLPFYSSYPLVLDNVPNYPFDSGQFVFMKQIKLPDFDTIYRPGSPFPTYYDLVMNPTSDSNFDSLNQLNDIFVSNIDKSLLSTTEVKYNFNYYSQDWVSSLRFQFDYFGRIDNGTYYSYEPITCSGSWGSSYGNVNNLYTASLNNISCSSDLTNYDYIYLRIRKSYSATNYDDTLYNFTYSTNNGYINVPNVSNGDNKYYIMDYFSNLPNNFNILLSSSSYRTNMTFKSDNENVLASLVDRNKNFISSLATLNLVFGSYNDSSVMVYNYTPNYSDTSNLYLFFSTDTIVSIGNNGSYTYYDSDNTIVNGNIDNTYQISYNSYDISYYMGVVSSFIGDLESSSLEIANLTQTFYNGLPAFFQSCIFVIFILFCSYFTYLLLKK